MRHRRQVSIALCAAAVGVLLPGFAAAELGWKEAAYAKQFGPAGRSPITPDQARFSCPGGGSLLVRFADGRSIEEAWSIDRDESFVPKPLMDKARAAAKGQPVRQIHFQRRNVAPAEIFEAHDRHTTLEVDTRYGGIGRIVLCRGDKPCPLLDTLLTIERAADDLMARTEAQMRREGH